MDRRSGIRGWRLAVAFVIMPLGMAWAEEGDEAWSTTVLAGESPPTLRRLEAADKLAAAGKWSEALDDYLAIIADAGDVLVPLERKLPRRAVQARWLCHLRLASLAHRHPATLRQYRSQVDDRAARWLRDGKKARDAVLLQRIVDEAFCSRPGAEALELLGDLAAERGRFDDTQRWWRLLVWPASEADRLERKELLRTQTLVYPDPLPAQVARVRAKQIVVRLFQGDRFGLADEIKAYRALHGQATGELAGQRGKYADLLARLAADRRLASFQEADDVWNTFGGRPSRNLMGAQPLHGRIAANGPTWSVRLDSGEAVTLPQKDANPLGGTPARLTDARSLAFYPLIAGNLVLWADARYVNAHDLLTGRRVFRFDLLRDRALDQAVLKDVDLTLPARAGLRYSLTAAGDRVYVRLGTQGLAPLRPKVREEADPRQSFLLCLKPTAPAGERLVWFRGNLRKSDKDPPVFFEGAPLVQDHRVYIAVSRTEAAQTRTAVHCYDADSGKPLWQQDVCVTSKGKDSEDARYRHHLLTLAGTRLVYCSHAGAIVALEAATGQRAWGFRYASRGRLTADGDPSPRDLAPCVYASGRVFAAPRDSNRLFCLDADTGRSLWELDGIEVVHLLGVAEGRLIFTTPAGIRAVSAAGGTAQGGWLQPSDGKLPPFGRGFLAGGWVYWPTRDPETALRGLNVADGSQERGEEAFYANQYRRIERGNLVFGNGCLAVAGAEVLTVYVPEKRYLSQRKAEAARQDAKPAAFYRLALAEADAGQYPVALAHLVRAESARPDEKEQGLPVGDLARQARQALLLDLARLRQADRQWSEGAAWYGQAAGSDLPVAGRLLALRGLADMWSSAGRPLQAVAAWQAILDDRVLRRGQITAPHGTPQRAATVAAAGIDALIRRHGAVVYAPMEARARLLLASAQGAHQVAVLEQLAWQYPNAVVTGPALLRLGQHQEHAHRPMHAAQAYRQVLRRGATPPLVLRDLAVARAGLARSYEQQHRWAMARAAWQRLAAQAGTETIASLDPDHTVRDFVARQLEKTAYDSHSDLPRAPMQLPLTRRWPVQENVSTVAPPAQRLVVVEGHQASAKPVALLVSGAAPCLTLTCRGAASGEKRWQCPLARKPLWAALHGGSVVVAASRTVHSISQADGKPLWEFTAPAPPLVVSSGSPDFDLASFRLTRTTIFCLQGERRLFALDADSGRVLWSHWAPGGQVRPLYPAGRFNPFFHADEHWVVMQAGSGKRLVLDSRSGRLVHEADGGPALWLQPPLVLGKDRLGLVRDARHVVLFDPAAGKDLWVYPTSRQADTTTLSGEPPRLVGDSQALLVVVAHNVGYQLQRLNPDTGAPLWPAARGVLHKPIDPGRADWDRSTVYYSSGNLLCARSLANGQLLWAQPLPRGGSDWRAVWRGNWVLAYPAHLNRRPRTLTFPVLICDPKDGALVQRLNFDAATPQAAMQVFANGLVAEAGGRAWGLSSGQR